MNNVGPALVMMVGAMVVALGACRDPAGVEPAPTTYLNTGSDATYVGKQVCRTCHPVQYDTFIQSEMGRSFKPATLSNSVADFERPRPVYDEFKDLYYQPFHVDEELFLMEYRLAGRDTVHKRVEKIDYIVGSGQHTNSHIMDENGYLYQMPLTWYAQDGRWDLPPKFDGGNNTRFDRPIPLECMVCHNGTPTFVDGSENRYIRVPSGIDCEKCHGPGSVHVQAMHAGRVVNTVEEIDYTIVNARKLPVDRQFDICQRCHMQGASVFAEGKTPLDFRPSNKLSDIENVYWPRYTDSVTRFTMASHPDRLRMSQCYAASHAAPTEVGAMTCITCHNPHVGVKTLATEYYNDVCASCHPGKGPLFDVACSEDAAVRDRVADDCVSCHMPLSGSIDIPHIRITDHFIRKPGDDTMDVLSGEKIASDKQFLGMASLIDASPSDKNIAEGYLSYYEQISNHPGFLDSAMVHLERAIDGGETVTSSLIRQLFLKGDYRSVVAITDTLKAEIVNDAWTSYRIGDSHLLSGLTERAIAFLERCVHLAPSHLRFMTRLGDAYAQAEHMQEALSMYDRVLAANPKFHEAYNNRGFARVLVRDLAGAESDFLQSLALEPDEPQTIANIASLYYNLGRYDEARPFVQRLIEINPNDPGYRQLSDLLK